MGKNIVLWLVILAVLLTVFSNFNVDSQNPPVKYSEFLLSCLLYTSDAADE